MILERGNMWSVFGQGIFMITTNPTIRNDGAVVMGRGIALETKERYPRLPYDFAKALKALHPDIDKNNVGLIGVYDNTPIWWFMVKYHWANPARLEIINDSVFSVMHEFACLRGARIDLNFPGIGNGRLERKDVLPLLEKLPDNVHIWEKI